MITADDNVVAKYQRRTIEIERGAVLFTARHRPIVAQESRHDHLHA